MILLVDLQMLGKDAYSFSDQGNLHLRRTGIGGVHPELTNNLAGICHVENLPEIGTGIVALYRLCPTRAITNELGT